jgi:hypothetical protein
LSVCVEADDLKLKYGKVVRVFVSYIQKIERAFGVEKVKLG